MNLIIPMAGQGKRLRPHTLTTPKPLIPIAGKPIVQRLVEDIVKVTPEPLDTIGFVVGDFGHETEKKLHAIAEQVETKCEIIHQEEALGTAHAIWCARQLLNGKVSVAFADTLFRAAFTLDTSKDGIVWVKEIDDPSAFGVVKTNAEGIITEFIEKPKKPVSNQAIIGIYYFREGAHLKSEIEHLIENDIRGGGEFQLTMALESMKQKGTRFSIGKVDDWLDCGNKSVTVASNSAYLHYLNAEDLVHSKEIYNSVLIPPVYVGKGAIIRNSVVGPEVSIGSDTIVENSCIDRSLVQNHSILQNVRLSNAMIGNYVKLKQTPADISLGDYSSISQ